MSEIMKEPGINVILNGHLYHFNEPSSLDMLLKQTANSISETDKDNAVLYDDELVELILRYWRHHENST